MLTGTYADPAEPLGIISLPDERYSHVARRHAKLVVRLGGNGKVKARLRLRGGKIGMGFISFLPSPRCRNIDVRNTAIYGSIEQLGYHHG